VFRIGKYGYQIMSNL